MSETDKEELVKTIIKGRTVIYYLVTEGDLEQIKASSIFADIALFISTTTLGVYLTQNDKKDNILLVVAILSLFVSVFFYYLKYSLIHKVKKSGEIEKLQASKKAIETFKIIKSTYGIPGQNKDVTNKLNTLIKDEQLNIQATNALVDKDPAPGIKKFINIEYTFNGIKLEKIFNENDSVNLP